MSDIAGMMRDGTLCQGCGVYIGPSEEDDEHYIRNPLSNHFELLSDPPGYPLNCIDCGGRKDHYPELWILDKPSPSRRKRKA